MRTGRINKEIKELESKHMCSDAPELIIQVEVLKIDKQVPEYFRIVPAIAPVLNPTFELFEFHACPIFTSLMTC